MRNLSKKVLGIVLSSSVFACSSIGNVETVSQTHSIEKQVLSSELVLPELPKVPDASEIDKLTKKSGFSIKAVSGNLSTNFSTIGLRYTPNLIQYLWGTNFENGKLYKLNLKSNSNQIVYGFLFKKINGNWIGDRWISSNDNTVFQGGKIDFSEIYVYGFCSENATSGSASITEENIIMTKEELGKILLKNNFSIVTQDYLSKYDGGTPCTRSYHPGIDYRAKTGTPVYSPVSGTVSHTIDSIGQVVVKINNSRKRFIFLHLSKSSLKMGNWVNEGDLIGYSGSTGTSAAHLHVELRNDKDGASCYFSSPGNTGTNENPINFKQ